MKNLLITLGLILAVCAVAGGVCYVGADNRAMHAAAREGDAMAWLRLEFQLNDGQFKAIKQLHENYSIACGRHCAAIMDARTRQAPAAEVAALEKICVAAMAEHFHQVAALMPADQSERYLAVVLPRIAGYAHHGAPNVRVMP